MSPASKPAKRALKATAKTPTRTRAARRPVGASKTAAKAKATAKANGASGRNVTSAQRCLRDSAIVSAAQAGYTQKEIAEDYGLTERQVRRVLSERAKVPRLLDEAPGQVLDDMVANYRQMIATLDAMALRYAESHPHAALGAERAAMDARERLMELLTRLGHMPADLGLFRAESVLRGIAEEMAQTMGRALRGEITTQEAADYFGSLVSSDTQEQRKALRA
jgi:hypothetical protein